MIKCTTLNSSSSVFDSRVNQIERVPVSAYQEQAALVRRSLYQHEERDGRYFVRRFGNRYLR